MVDVSDMTREMGLRLLAGPPQLSRGRGDIALFWPECMFAGLLRCRSGCGEVDFMGACWGAAGNEKFVFRVPEAGLLRRLFCRPSCGVLPADTVPGRRRAGRIGNASPEVSVEIGGVMDSWSGDGCRGDIYPVIGLAFGGTFGEICKLALLPCTLKGRFAIGAATGPRPSLGTSLPIESIDKDLPCPFADFTALFGAFEATGALCSPALEGPLTTLSDSVGR